MTFLDRYGRLLPVARIEATVAELRVLTAAGFESQQGQTVDGRLCYAVAPGPGVEVLVRRVEGAIGPAAHVPVDDVMR